MLKECLSYSYSPVFFFFAPTVGESHGGVHFSLPSIWFSFNV